MSILIKSRQIQMYAGEPPKEVWGGLDVVEFYTSLIKKEQQNSTELHKLLVQEQNKSQLLENYRANLATDLTNKNNEINTILTKWKAKDLTELSGNIQDIINDISQKDKTINSLQLKNEKLTDSYKKLIQHLADARLLVSHLQTDLQTEKQDKEHIQNELNNALAILNKPTATIGTQTDLTAEQITQMEQDLEYFRKLLYQGALEIDGLEKELSVIREEQIKKEQEIKDLINQVKDLTLNEDEKQIVEWANRLHPNMKTDSINSIIYLLNSYFNTEKWKRLREEFQILANRANFLANTLLKIEEKDKELNKKKEELDSENQKLTELQTKYDREVKTKEELLEYLAIYREMNVISFSSYPNSFAGNRLFSNLDDEQEIKVEKMENFKKFMEQHGKVNAVVYLCLTDNKLMELGNKHSFGSVRVWTSNVGKKYPKQNKKGQVWFKNNNRNWNISDWKNDEMIIGIDYRTNIINFSNPFISTSNGSSGFEFKW